MVHTYISIALILLGPMAMAVPQENELEIIAHRGVHQIFKPGPIGPNDCTATKIEEPVHDYIENTLYSIGAAFRLGADIVEIDIQMTKDHKFVVFHDAELSCRTQLSGPIRSYLYKELVGLDVGYGYTSDGGASYPLRCQAGVVGYELCQKRNGLPGLRDVLRRFKHQRFVLNLKSSSPEILESLKGNLKKWERQGRLKLENLGFYSSNRAALAFVRQHLPGIETPKMTLGQMRQCLVHWDHEGFFEDSCKEGVYLVPLNTFRKMGIIGVKLERDIHQYNSRLYIANVNSKEDLGSLRGYYLDGVVTDQIEEIGLGRRR